MTRRALIGLVVLVLVAGGAACWYFWDELFNPGPDRTELVRKTIEASGLEGVHDLKCRQVRGSFLKRVRKDFPTLEVVDCTCAYKDSLGHKVSARYHFWILDGKVIKTENLSYQQLQGGKSPDDQEKYARFVIASAQDPAKGREMKEQFRRAAQEGKKE